MMKEMKQSIIKNNIGDIRFRATLARAYILNYVYSDCCQIDVFYSCLVSQVEIKLLSKLLILKI